MKKSMFNRVAALVVVLWMGSASGLLAAKPVTFPFEGAVFGQFTGDCGGFNVLADFTYHGKFWIFFDNDGNEVRLREHTNYRAIYYPDTDPDAYISAAGEVQNLTLNVADDTLFVTGLPVKVTVPGYGVVHHQAGRTVLDLSTFEILFQAGPSDVNDEDFDALCVALAP